VTLQGLFDNEAEKLPQTFGFQEPLGGKNPHRWKSRRAGPRALRYQAGPRCPQGLSQCESR
jgi:hypothetical protein